MPYGFAERVKIHFEYLIRDYGFQEEIRRVPEIFGDRVVDYQSDDVGVELLLDRGEVAVRIGPRSDSPEKWIDIRFLLPFVVPEIDEPVYVYPAEGDSCEAQVEWQIARLARLVRHYLTPVLRGEFTRWEEVVEYWRERGKAFYREQTGLDVSA